MIPTRVLEHIYEVLLGVTDLLTHFSKRHLIRVENDLPDSVFDTGILDESRPKLFEQRVFEDFKPAGYILVSSILSRNERTNYPKADQHQQRNQKSHSSEPEKTGKPNPS